MHHRRFFIPANFKVVARLLKVLGWAILCAVVSGTSPVARLSSQTDVPCEVVRRAELAATVLASGHVESAIQTVIRCELENVQGRRMADGRRCSAAILALVPEGKRVRAGEILCRLDTSEHEELARLQTIAVAQGRAAHRRAQLDLETAEIGLRQYVEGLYRLRRQEFQGSIALAEAEVSRLAGRLNWTQRMFAKGYVSRAQRAGDVAALDRAKVGLARIRGELRNFENFQAVRARRELEIAVASAKIVLAFQSQRLQSEETRLADLERQIAASIIRAPHDGIVVLAHKPKRGVRIEEGLWVRKNQPLIYLPDCTKLAVQVELHETILDQVRPGMRARVRFEGAGRLVHGKLTSIDQLPLSDRNSQTGPDVRYYLGHVDLDEVPRDLRLGMAVQVSVETAVRPDALVVPADAVGSDGNRHFCLVAGEEGLKRRTVALGRSTAFLQEVTQGLEEGEKVALLGPVCESHDAPASASNQLRQKFADTWGHSDE
jgi:HlyD family secretion protein